MIESYIFNSATNQFKNGKINIYNQSCPLCTFSFRSKVLNVVQAPCQGRHVFHVNCLNSWLNTQLDYRLVSTCPRCGTYINIIRQPLSQVSSNIDHEVIVAAAKNMFEMDQELERDLESRFMYLSFALQHGIAEALPHFADLRFEMGQEHNRELESRLFCLNFALISGIAEAQPLIAQVHSEIYQKRERELGSSFGP